MRVLLRRKGTIQDKGYKQGFSDEIFLIYRIQTKHQTGYLAHAVYHLKDLLGEKIIGGWLADELTPIEYNKDTEEYKVNEILDTRINKKTRRKEYFVRFGISKTIKRVDRGRQLAQSKMNPDDSGGFYVYLSSDANENVYPNNVKNRFHQRFGQRN